MTYMPRFSVIIPNYNNAETLARAIDSVLAQSFPAHEIIVIDDGSTDASRQVAASYGDKVIYQYQSNAGVSAARNLGAARATGDWLAFLDADDAYFADRLKKHAAWISAEPDLDFLLGDQEHRWPDGRPFMRTFDSCAAGRALIARYPSEDNIPLGRSDFEELIADGFAEIRTLSVPRTTFLELGGFPRGVRIGEDLHFVVRLLANSSKGGVSNSVLAAYYIYQGSALRKNVLRTNREFVATLDSLTDVVKDAGPSIVLGLRKKQRRARLSLAYALLRENQRMEALRSVLPTLTAHKIQGILDVMSVLRGLPKA